MHEAAPTPAWVLLAYLVSGVCFILALRGLSSPESSRRGNRAGMIGMAIAVVTTLVTHYPLRDYAWPPGNPFDARIDFETLGLIFGGFAVTARMLAMYKKKER